MMLYIPGDTNDNAVAVALINDINNSASPDSYTDYSLKVEAAVLGLELIKICLKEIGL